MSKLSEVIERMQRGDSTLTSVDFAYALFSNEEVEAFAKELGRSWHVKALKLFGCCSHEQLKILAKAFETNTSLQSIDIYLYELGEGSNAIVRALAKNALKSQLKGLFLHGIGSDGLENLAGFLATNRTLTYLSLDGITLSTKRDDKLMDKGLIALAQGVLANPHSPLYSLNLEFPFGNEGAKAIATLLKGNKSITSMELNCMSPSSPTLTDIGRELIANALIGNTKLKTLSIPTQKGGERAARAFSNALNTNTTLENFYGLDPCFVSRRTMMLLSDRLDRNLIKVGREPIYSKTWYSSAKESKATSIIDVSHGPLVDIDAWEKLSAPLLLAANDCKLEEVKRLLDAGIDIETCSAKGTALEIICCHNHCLSHSISEEKALPVVKFLVERGAKVTTKIVGNGFTLLHGVVDWCQFNTEAALILLEAGADYGAQNFDGQTSADYARTKGKKDLAELIEREGPRIKALRATGSLPLLRSPPPPPSAVSSAGIISSLAPSAGVKVLLKMEEETSSSAVIPVAFAPIRTEKEMEEKKQAAKVVIVKDELSLSASTITTPSVTGTGLTESLRSKDVATQSSNDSKEGKKAGASEVDVSSAPLDQAALAHLHAVPVLVGRLGMLEKKVDQFDMNPQVLKNLCDQAGTLTALVIQERGEDQLHQAILSNEGDFTYYSMISVLICGTQRACEGAFSGYGVAGKSYPSDKVAMAFEAVGSIPVVGIVAKFIADTITGAIKAKNFKDRNFDVMRLAFFFVGAKQPEEFLRQFARILTFARREKTQQLAVTTYSAAGLLDKVKTNAVAFKDWITSDGSSHPVKAQARKDWELLIMAILDGTLTAPPQQEAMLAVLVGQQEATRVLTAIKAQAVSTGSSPALSPVIAEEKRSVSAQTVAVSTLPTAAAASSTAMTVAMPRRQSDPTAKLLAKFSMLEEAHALLREELAAQRAKTEAAEAELKRQKEEHGQAERKLEVLHKKVLDLSPNESPVAGQGSSLQAVLSRNASPLAGAGHAHDTARELAILNQRVTTVAGEVVVSKESIARLQQRADRSAQKPAKKEESDKCLVM